MPTIIQQSTFFNLYQPLSTLTDSNEQTNFAAHNLNKEKMKKKSVYVQQCIIGLFVVSFDRSKGDQITWLW
ncbi:MAG: hypothetical protein IPM10_12620 [Chitinophagaceae bacterium]|nr:hypothetical protein [Chitinophagaceae bacterium]